jgi:hypothetical protein
MPARTRSQTRNQQAGLDNQELLTDDDSLYGSANGGVPEEIVVDAAPMNNNNAVVNLNHGGEQEVNNPGVPNWLRGALRGLSFIYYV